MRAKAWLAVRTGMLFVGAVLVWIADVGSGEGPVIFPLAERTGEPGVVDAVDINPNALRKVERLAQKRGEGPCLA
jgi:ubiquinone/menaquinone biosynthesis C-methylase UbiE